jgi:hypothetical protein
MRAILHVDMLNEWMEDYFLLHLIPNLKAFVLIKSNLIRGSCSF